MRRNLTKQDRDNLYFRVTNAIAYCEQRAKSWLPWVRFRWQRRGYALGELRLIIGRPDEILPAWLDDHDLDLLELVEADRDSRRNTR